MTEWKAHRFWTQADVAAVQGGYEVRLDSLPLRTPGKLPLVLPTRALAQAMAEEWDAQQGAIDPGAMPLTRAANSAVERVLAQFDAVADMLANYGGTDLLCYRAQAPQELVARQAAVWDPLLRWTASHFGAQLSPTTGVMPIDQPATSLATLSQAVRALTPFQLAAFHDLVAISGSLVLALAIIHGHLSPDAAFDASRLDEHWQADLWGRDDEAAESEAFKRQSLLHAARFFELCG